MARYIDAERLRDSMLNYYQCVHESSIGRMYQGDTLMDYEVVDMIEDCIDNAPSADVVEVKHSKWVVTAYDNQDNILVIDYIKHQHSMPYCLNCKGDALLDGGEEYVTSDYCPHCGAKMDGGKAE